MSMTFIYVSRWHLDIDPQIVTLRDAVSLRAHGYIGNRESAVIRFVPNDLIAEEVKGILGTAAALGRKPPYWESIDRSVEFYKERGIRYGAVEFHRPEEDGSHSRSYYLATSDELLGYLREKVHQRELSTLVSISDGVLDDEARRHFSIDLISRWSMCQMAEVEPKDMS